MRPRTLLLLFALVAGLGAFIWFVERDLPGSDERAEQAKRVLAVEADGLSSIAWTLGDEQRGLTRDSAVDGAPWMLSEPLSARADGSSVDRLVGALSALEKERTLEAADPSGLGLVPPRGEIVLSGDGEQRLLIGGEIPASDSMIVAPSTEGPYHVVAKGLWDLLLAPVDDWRDRTVYPGSQGDIEQITLEREGGRLSFLRRDGAFWIVDPIEDLADEGTVSRLLTALTSLEVAEFLEGPPEGADAETLPPAGGALEVVSGEAPPWRLELGRTPGDAGEEATTVTARAEGHLFSLGVSLEGALTRPLAQWRSLEWVGRQVFEIQALDLMDEAGSISLVRESGNWLRDGEAVEFNVVNDLLYALTGTKAEALDAVEAIAGEAILTATINPGPEEQILEVFPGAGDRYPARSSRRATALWLGGDGVRNLASSVADLRAAERLVPEPAESDGSEAETPVVTEN